MENPKTHEDPARRSNEIATDDKDVRPDTAVPGKFQELSREQ